MTISIRHGAALTALTVLLAGCGSGPVIRTYELGHAAPVANAVRSEAGLPIIELRAVAVPDYLDSRDILRSVGANEITASPTGRWGERLSLGLTHALAASLAERLPQTVIATTAGAAPARRLLVDIQRFEIAADGQCLLGGQWRLTTIDGETIASGERGDFSEAAGSIADAAIAAAMTRAVDQLAGQIGQTVTAALAKHSG